MTHEYVIALGGWIESGRLGRGDAEPTAVAWAADHVLAVGLDDVVRSISRGDSTFLDLRGCVVTALPDDPAGADALVRENASSAAPDLDLEALLIGAGLLDPGSDLEPGSPADLAFWDVGPEPGRPGRRPALRLVAMVRDGAFTEGDEHYGPFRAASGSQPN